MLAAYEPPPLDPGIDEGLRDYRARRLEAIRAGAA
jgi:trimethylamine:corrinoid methyltransferase-like protein